MDQFLQKGTKGII